MHAGGDDRQPPSRAFWYTILYSLSFLKSVWQKLHRGDAQENVAFAVICVWVLESWCKG